MTPGAFVVAFWALARVGARGGRCRLATLRYRDELSQLASQFYERTALSTNKAVMLTGGTGRVRPQFGIVETADFRHPGM